MSMRSRIGCGCRCHTSPHVKHMVACCDYPPYEEERMSAPGEVMLGDVAKDQISGFDGVVVAITEWLNGCRRITIQPQRMHEGKLLETETFDEQQVEVVVGRKTPVPNLSRREQSKATRTLSRTGGPTPAPTRNVDPV